MQEIAWSVERIALFPFSFEGEGQGEVGGNKRNTRYEKFFEIFCNILTNLLYNDTLFREFSTLEVRVLNEV